MITNIEILELLNKERRRHQNNMMYARQNRRHHPEQAQFYENLEQSEYYAYVAISAALRLIDDENEKAAIIEEKELNHETHSLEQTNP